MCKKQIIAENVGWIDDSATIDVKMYMSISGCRLCEC